MSKIHCLLMFDTITEPVFLSMIIGHLGTNLLPMELQYVSENFTIYLQNLLYSLLMVKEQLELKNFIVLIVIGLKQSLASSL